MNTDHVQELEIPTDIQNLIEGYATHVVQPGTYTHAWCAIMATTSRHFELVVHNDDGKATYRTYWKPAGYDPDYDVIVEGTLRIDVDVGTTEDVIVHIPGGRKEKWANLDDAVARAEGRDNTWVNGLQWRYEEPRPAKRARTE